MTLIGSWYNNSIMSNFLPDCSLCHVTRGVILENDFWTLVLNENQATLGRVFFALNRHETDVAALTEDECESLWSFLTRTKRAWQACSLPITSITCF